MDVLKKELERKRKTFEQDFGGRKFVRRSEIEQRALQRKREEEKREVQEKTTRKGVGGIGDDALVNPDTSSSLLASSKASSKARENANDEEKIDDMMLPKAEVIRRLRYLKHPITLFGEDDDARQKRLKALLKAGITDPDSELMEGQRNDFLVDMAELRKREKHGRLEPRKEKNKEKDGGGGGVEDGDKDGGGGGDQNINGDGGLSSGVDNDKDMKVYGTCGCFLLVVPLKGNARYLLL
jgi:pre-mRNA-splicing factor 18